MTDEITYDEIEQIKEGVCDGCKGLFTLHETGCYERCEPFQEELKEIRNLETDLEKEIWKQVKNFPGYDISNLGRVRSYKVSWKDPRILVGSITWNGYNRVTLRRQNKGFHFFIHRLVLEAFIGPCPDGYETNHKNGVKTDNRLKKLEWIASGKNQTHAYQTGLRRAPKAKLRDEEVLEIRRLVKSGIKQTIVAKMFKVSPQNVNMIIHRLIWNYI